MDHYIIILIIIIVLILLLVWAYNISKDDTKSDSKLIFSNNTEFSSNLLVTTSNTGKILLNNIDGHEKIILDNPNIPVNILYDGGYPPRSHTNFCLDSRNAEFTEGYDYNSIQFYDDINAEPLVKSITIQFNTNKLFNKFTGKLSFFEKDTFNPFYIANVHLQNDESSDIVKIVLKNLPSFNKFVGKKVNILFEGRADTIAPKCGNWGIIIPYEANGDKNFEVNAGNCLYTTNFKVEPCVILYKITSGVCVE